MSAAKPEPQPGANADGTPLHPVCRDAGGHTHLVVLVGRLYLSCVVLPRKKGKIHLGKVDAIQHGLTPLMLRKPDGTAQLYPVKKAVRSILKMAKLKGITDGARDALDNLKEQVSAPTPTAP